MGLFSLKMSCCGEVAGVSFSEKCMKSAQNFSYGPFPSITSGRKAKPPAATPGASCCWGTGLTLKNLARNPVGTTPTLRQVGGPRYERVSGVLETAASN